MEEDKNQDRKEAELLNKKLHKFKRESKSKLIILKEKRYYEKPSESKKRRFADAQRRTRSQQRED